MSLTEITNKREKRWTALDAGLAAAETSLRDVVEQPAAAPNAPLDLSQAMITSELALPKYATVDKEVIEEIKSKLTRISAYIDDTAAHRPLTFILTAEPGSGKSHFVKCLAKDCEIPLVTANIASLEKMSELGYWIDEIRNHKMEDKTPVLFIDEADSKPDDLSAFLPLLWDGLFSWQGRSFNIGRCVIVLVASNVGLRRYVEDGTEGDVKQSFPKIEDLLSRINGGVMKLGDIDDRRPDKLCIALTQIRRRFSNVTAVQLPFLKILVNTRFLHSSRSMEALVDFFPAPDNMGQLRITAEFEAKLETFLEKKTFRNNVFAFHLNQGERVNAKQTWAEHRKSETMVVF